VEEVVYLVDRRECAGADVKGVAGIVLDLDRVGRPLLARRQHPTDLLCDLGAGVELEQPIVRRERVERLQNHAAHVADIGFLSSTSDSPLPLSPPAKGHARGLVVVLEEDGHGGPQAQRQVHRLKVAVREEGRQLHRMRDVIILHINTGRET